MIGHQISDRQHRSHAVKRAGTRQWKLSAVACRTRSLLPSHKTEASPSFCLEATATTRRRGRC